MKAQRASLREVDRRTRRPFSIVLKTPPAGTTVSSDTTTPTPTPERRKHLSFELAFESLWSALVHHSGPYLLEEGIKRAKVSCGFWIAWKSGAQMSIEYISARRWWLTTPVVSYNLETTVCFIMIVV